MSFMPDFVRVTTGLNGMAFNLGGAPIVPIMEGAPCQGGVGYFGKVLHGPMGNSLDGFVQFVLRNSPSQYSPSGTRTMLGLKWGKGNLATRVDGLEFSCPVFGNPKRVFEARLQVTRRGEPGHYDISSHLGYFSGEHGFAVMQYAAIEAICRDPDREMFRTSQPPCGISTIVVLGGVELLRGVAAGSVLGKDEAVNPRSALRLASMFARKERMTFSIYDGADNLQATSEATLGDDLRVPTTIAAFLDPPHDKKVEVSKRVRTSYDRVTPVHDYPGYGVVYLPGGVELPEVAGARRQLSGPLAGVWQTLTFNEGGAEPFSSPVVDMVLAAEAIWPEVFPLRR